MSGLTHLDEHGSARMVDVGAKAETARSATATGRIAMNAAALAAIRDGTVPKGDVLATARIAGIQAAKKTWDLIPLCHPLLLTGVTVTIEPEGADALCVQATCKLKGTTGVEMEALTAASVASLTLYDMCKAVDRGMVIESVCLLEKSGGRSGQFRRED